MGSTGKNVVAVVAVAVLVVLLVVSSWISLVVVTENNNTAGGQQHRRHRSLETQWDRAFTPLPLVSYQQSPVEEFVMAHAEELEFSTELDELAVGCKIWSEPVFILPHQKLLSNDYYEELQQYRGELKEYYKAVKSFNYFSDRNITDLRHLLLVDDATAAEEENRNPIYSPVCQRLGGNLQQQFFSGSRQLAYSPNQGWMEPLLSPLRHPNLCFHRSGDPETLDAFSLDYLVHDFAMACRKLKPTSSRIVLFDLGATRKFWEVEHPVWELVRLWERFGFKMDHIYAYENRYLNDGSVSIESILSQVPKRYQGAYHWIHSELSIEPGHPLNPWTIVEQEYTPDDLVLFKIDIGPSHHEVMLIQQLMDSPKLLSIVDHLYYEHKVHLLESSRAWGGQMIGSVADSLQLFATLRDKGVAAHHWV